MNFSEEGGALLTGKIWKPTFLLELESEPVKNGPAPEHCTHGMWQPVYRN